MEARNRIEEWFHRLEQPGERMKREDVSFIMVQVRHLIEKSKTPEKYLIANFYADWTVHTMLDRSIVCFEILKDITKVISDNFNKEKVDINREISKIIGLPKLRLELMNLFRNNKLPVILFEYLVNWQNFVMFLLWFIEGQVIKFPVNHSNKSNKIRNEMIAIKRPHNIAVESLTIINYQGVYHWLLDVSGEKKIKMLGQVEMAEEPNKFIS